MIYSFLNKLNKIEKFPYFICTPIPYCIGTASEQWLIAIKQASILKKKVIIIVPTILQKILKYKIFNDYFFNELKVVELTKKDKLFKSVFKILINSQFLFNRIITLFLDKFTNVKVSESFRFPEIGIFYNIKKKVNFDEIKLPQHKVHEVNLSKNANIYCLKKMQEIGIGKEDSFVCVHVRDNMYRNDQGRREFRNSDISNYKEAILYLLKKNYWVIRIGQLSNKRLEIDHPKFIDYPFSQFKDYCLDLYLIKNCKFLICSQSGMHALASLFNKPILLTNAVRLFPTDSSANNFSRTISKKPFWKKNKKLIPLENYLKLKYVHHHINFIDSEIDFEENSSSEILDATKEFLEPIEKKLDFKSKPNQIYFRDFILNSIKDHYYDTGDKNGEYLINVPEVFSMIIVLKESKELYCSFFLEKYFRF